MELTWSEEQEALRDSVRDFLQATSSVERVRELMETDEGYDPAVWRRMAEELGLQSMAIPEEYGGAGFGYPECAIVLEEMGRALYSGPFLSSAVIAAQLLTRSDDEAAKTEFLPAIADGSRIVTLVDGSAGEIVAEASGDGYALTGSVELVLDGHIADVFLVAAKGEHGVSILAIEADATGVTRSLQQTLDRTRKLAKVEFSGATGRLIGEEGASEPLLATVRAIAISALAAEQTGGAERALEITVDYVKIREQFGRKIGSFQAIKHRLADLLVAVQSASSASLYATSAIDEDSDELIEAALVAGTTCSEAFVNTAQQMIQLHGGIGYTWEHDAHLYLRRAKSSGAIFGAPHEHRAALADRLGF